MNFLSNQSTFTKVGLGVITVGLFLLVSGVANAADPAAWTSVTATGTLSNGMTLTIEEEQRHSGVDFDTLNSRHTDVAVGTTLGGFGVALGHRHADGAADFNYLTVSRSVGAIAGWDATLSTKLELFSDDSVRNRTGLAAQSAVSYSGFTPWASTEFFITEDGDVTSNRTEVGVTRALNASTALDVWYQVDTDMVGDADAAPAVGIGLNLAL